MLTIYDIGHVFPGATLPYGMAKAVADVVNDNSGGYASDGGDSKNTVLYYILQPFHCCVEKTHYKLMPDVIIVTGFSHMHDSGTGGVSDALCFSDPSG